MAYWKGVGGWSAPRGASGWAPWQRLGAWSIPPDSSGWTPGGSGAITLPIALNALLPPQAGNAGKALTTDGTNAAWEVAVPDGSETGDFLRWNAATEAWEVASEMLPVKGLILTPALSSLVDAEGAIYYDSKTKAVMVCVEA